MILGTARADSVDGEVAVQVANDGTVRAVTLGQEIESGTQVAVFTAESGARVAITPTPPFVFEGSITITEGSSP